MLLARLPPITGYLWLPHGFHSSYDKLNLQGSPDGEDATQYHEEHAYDQWNLNAFEFMEELLQNHHAQFVSINLRC